MQKYFQVPENIGVIINKLLYLIFTFESYRAMVDRFRGASTQPVYSRVDNPTVSVLLDKMCQLERGEAAAAFSSGIAAISNAILGQVETGDRIVCVKHVYPDFPLPERPSSFSTVLP